MKDIKSFLIGFLSCVCIMLFMGQTNQPNKSIGRYQGFGGNGDIKCIIYILHGAMSEQEIHSLYKR